MLSVEEITDWLGEEVRDSDGESLGKLEDVYYGSDGQPQLALVKHGLLGRKQALVPLAGATVGREYVRVGYSSEQVERANEAVDAGTGTQIGGGAAQQLGNSFGLQIPAGDLDSAAALRERQAASQEAEERAAQLEAEAQRQAEAAKSAHSEADERSGQAADTQQEAQRAREEADQLGQ